MWNGANKECDLITRWANELGLEIVPICPEDDLFGTPRGPIRLIQIGEKIESGDGVEIKIGNTMKLKSIPLGTQIHNVELVPGGGGKLSRSAGSSVTLSGFVISGSNGMFSSFMNCVSGSLLSPRTVLT